MRNCFLRWLTVCFCWGMTGLNILWAQVVQSPLAVTPLLSGNFGELRETHFHSGIDLKTGGKEGMPVLCVNDGILVRIRISPVGYGHALYVEHPDGTTTVYGHLQRYTKVVKELARALQYARESFTIDEDVRDRGICFKRGDTIAYSGNTGSSGGPHLHFECRDTRTEATLNPLLFLKIKDQIAPRVRALYFYRRDGKGCVERVKRIVPDKQNGSYRCREVTLPEGEWGIGAFITDAMNDSWNKLGLYRLQLRVNGEICFELSVDTCFFNRNYLVNALKDPDLYRLNRETVYCMFGPYVHLVSGVNVVGEGMIGIKEGEKVNIEIAVSDMNGNMSRVALVLSGKGKVREKSQKVVHYKQSHVLEREGYTLTLDSGSLFCSVPEMAVTDTITLADGCMVRAFVTALREISLMHAGTLLVRGTFDPRSVICRITDKKLPQSLPTELCPEGLNAKINHLGKYAVLTDTVAPQVSYLGVIYRNLKFSVRDELSGIASYRGEVNGKWCLFEYDAKNDMLMCSLKEPGFVKGTNSVVLSVRDRVGNETVRRITVNL